MASAPLLAPERRVEQFEHGRILIDADRRMQESTVRVMPGQFPPYTFHPGIPYKRQPAPGYVGQIIVDQLGDALTKIRIVAN